MNSRPSTHLHCRVCSERVQVTLIVRCRLTPRISQVACLFIIQVFAVLLTAFFLYHRILTDKSQRPIYNASHHPIRLRSPLRQRRPCPDSGPLCRPLRRLLCRRRQHHLANLRGCAALSARSHQRRHDDHEAVPGHVAAGIGRLARRCCLRHQHAGGRRLLPHSRRRAVRVLDTEQRHPRHVDDLHHRLGRPCLLEHRLSRMEQLRQPRGLPSALLGRRRNVLWRRQRLHHHEFIVHAEGHR
jgi:hypothetical protein